MSEDNKPIGWWAKRLDQVLEESLDALLVDDGVTRREWQLLNVAGAGGTAADLAPFATEAAVDELTGRGWVTADPGAGTLALSPSGEAVRKRVGGKVQEQRRAAMAGIAPQEYTTAVTVLRRMAENLAGGRR